MEISHSESIIQKWLSRGEHIEKRGLADWDQRLAELKLPEFRPRFYRSLAERVSVLIQEGLIDHPVILASADTVLKDGYRIFENAGFNCSRPVWCTIQDERQSSGHPNIKGEPLTPFSLLNLLDDLQWRFPNAKFNVTVFPFIHGTHQASLMVNSDRSIILEVSACGQSVSKGGSPAFRAVTPPFQSWPLRCSSDNPTDLAIAELFLSKIPKIMCSDGLGREYKPGYYEMVAGTVPGTSIRRVAFNDYRKDSYFTL